MTDLRKRPVPIATVEAPVEAPGFDDLLRGLTVADEHGIVEPWAAVALSIAREVDRIRTESE